MKTQLQRGAAQRQFAALVAHHFVSDDGVRIFEPIQPHFGVPVRDEDGACVFEGLATSNVVKVMVALAQSQSCPLATLALVPASLHIAMAHSSHRLPVVALGLALLLALSHGQALAQYKWKDARGQTHVSDQPPPRDIPDKNVLQRPAPRPAAAEASPAAPPASAAGARLAAGERKDPELEQRRSRAEDEAKARAQADEQRASAQRAENCRRASQHLATLSAGTRLVRSNEQGERVVLDDTLRASEMAQARSVMASDCR